MTGEAGETFQWVVRGVRRDLAKAVVDVATRQRMTVGEVLNCILSAWHEDGTPLGAAQEGAETSSVGGQGETLQSQLDALNARVAALEALATMPVQKGKRTTRPKVEPRPSDAPLPTGDDSPWIEVQGKRRVLTEAGKAEVYRRMAAGETDPQIAQAIGLTQQGINKWRQKWRQQEG